MRFYNTQHPYYCGTDLHARSMFTHILDQEGKTVFERDLPAGPAAFLDAIGPFRQGLVVGCECMFAWYWLADLCEDETIPFTLGHALYMKAIHGGKSKNDRMDASKIAALLRGGSEAVHSNRAIHAALVRGLTSAGVPEAAVQLVPTQDRAVVGAMLTAADAHATTRTIAYSGVSPTRSCGANTPRP